MKYSFTVLQCGIEFDQCSKPLLDDQTCVYAEQYSEVCRGTIEGRCETHVLDKLFKMFNTNRPAGYMGRSMFISDVIVLDNDSMSQAFFCAPVGWDKITVGSIHEDEESVKCCNCEEFYISDIRLPSDDVDEKIEINDEYDELPF